MSATYKVMMVATDGRAKTSIIVASSESQAMQFANLQNHNKGYSAQFALKMFSGSPAD